MDSGARQTEVPVGLGQSPLDDHYRRGGRGDGHCRADRRSDPECVNDMTAVSVCLFIFAYLSAVVDGSREPTGLYPEDDTGRKGLHRYANEHPWIVAGALAGIAGTIAAFL